MENKAHYPQFEWHKEWVIFCELLKVPSERLQFCQCIAYYGLFGDYPFELQGRAKEYFDRRIKPNIDKQHAKMDAKRK